MAFSADQNKALSAPLVTSNIKKNPRGYDYVEAWHAIAEANRIFGFDGWSRETVEFKCVAEREREIGQNKAPGWGVSYTAKVRVTVGSIVREGCGTGHGIDRDLGLAHESALKEAESDAMKRALMTFGNPFGLALYDKERTNVADAPDESTLRYVEECKKYIAENSPETVKAWWLSDEQKKMRRDFDLDADTVSELKTLVLAKLPQPGKAA